MITLALKKWIYRDGGGGNTPRPIPIRIVLFYLLYGRRSACSSTPSSGLILPGSPRSNISSSTAVSTLNITNISSSTAVSTLNITNISSYTAVSTLNITNISSSTAVSTLNITNISSSTAVSTLNFKNTKRCRQH